MLWRDDDSASGTLATPYPSLSRPIISHPTKSMLAAHLSHPANTLLLKYACPRFFGAHCCQTIVRYKVTTLQFQKAPLFYHGGSGHSIRPMQSTKFPCASKNADNTVSQDNPLEPTNEPGDIPESFTDVPGTTNTKSKTLAIIYTCKVCNTRSAKQVNKWSIVYFTGRIISHFIYFTSNMIL